MIYKNKLTRFPPTKESRYNRFVYEGILTREEAMDKQKDAAYDPCGYGFYSYAVQNGRTSWECGASCD